MKNLNLSILAFMCIGMLASSCKKDNPDTTQPVIESIAKPLENDTLFTGSEIHIEGSITDDTELSQFKIDIHGASDGHSHGKLSSASFFEVIRIIDLAGKVQAINEHIMIPQEAAAGRYHVIMTAVDASGNQSDFVERDIFIRNSGDLIAPTITLNSPAQGGNYSLALPLTISALMSDNAALGDVEVKIYKGATVVYDYDVELAESTFSLNLVVPTTGWTAGDYTLEIIARDQVNNVSDFDVDFTMN